MLTYRDLVFAETSSPVDDDSQYGYVPTLYVCIIFVSLFGISTCKHFPAITNPIHSAV